MDFDWRRRKQKIIGISISFLAFYSIFLFTIFKKDIGYTKKFVGIPSEMGLPSEMDVVLLEFLIFKQQLIMFDFKK